MRRVGWFGALAIGTFTCIAGCGGSGSAVQASCTLSGANAGASLTFCEEIQGASPQDVESLRQSCGTPTMNLPDGASQVTAQFTYGPCSRDGAIGGCQIAAGSMTITQWYYDDGTGTQTPSDVQMACTVGGGIFVQA